MYHLTLHSSASADDGDNDVGDFDCGKKITVKKQAGGIEFVVEVKDDGSPPPGLGMQSVAVSDASYERMDEEARDRELRTAEELRDRIANTTHLELEPLDGLPPGQIAGLRKNQGKNLPKLSLRDTKEWVARHLIGVYDDQCKLQRIARSKT